jgi:type II secretory pathway pseudopilin PulG
MRAIFAFLFVIAFAASASAQSQKAKSREELMQQVLQAALGDIQNARCGSDRCAPATAEEKKNPPLTLSETSQVLGRGLFSGGADICGLEWSKRNYEPMMAYWRKQKKTERQLTLISIVHQIGMQQIQKQIGTNCPAEMKKDVESKLDFKPQG